MLLYKGFPLDQRISFVTTDLAKLLESKRSIEEYRTPWDIASEKSGEAIRLFGAPSKTIPIVVTYGNNAYQYEFTEEMTYGVLVALEDNPNFTITLFEYVLSRKDLDFLFLINNEDEADQKYVVNNGNKIIAFNTTDFIQGVMTASEWIGVDPHNIVNDLRFIDKNHNITRYNF